jgi:hypothetical protein
MLKESSEDKKVMNTMKGDWSIVSIGGDNVRVKIVHKGRGKYRIVEDNMDGKYLTTIIDAEDVVRIE